MTRVIGRVAGVFAAIAVLPFIGSCSMMRVAECNKLIGVANEQQEHVRKATSKLQASDSISDIENMASTMDSAAKAIDAVALNDASLKKFQKDYREMLHHAAKDCRDMVGALKAKDATKVTKAKQALSTIGPEESKVINSINNYCQGK